MSAERAMEVASVLLREGVLRRNEPEHRLIAEDLGKDPVLKEAVRQRLGAVGYLLVDDLGHIGVRVSADAENAWSMRNRMGLTSAHIRLIVYLWTQLVYREVVNLRRDLQTVAPAQIDFFDTADEAPFVSYRAVWNAFAERMSARHLTGVLRLLRRQRFIDYDEKRDRIWADGALYVLIDRTRMEEFVIELTRRLGGDDPAKAVEEVTTGAKMAADLEEDNQP